MPRQKKKTTFGPKELKGTRKSKRHVTNESGIPEVYQDMLIEAAASLPSPEGRVTKRRRLEELRLRAATPDLEFSSIEAPEYHSGLEASPVGKSNAQQTIYDDLAGLEESDVDFEDVDLEPDTGRSNIDAEDKKPLQLDLSQPSGQLENIKMQKRKPATTAEKKLRLDVHKWHVLCLMLHGHHRNRWCDNEEIQAILKPLIPRKLITLLHLDNSKPQYARNHGFNQAIEEIMDLWQREWTITAKGVRRAFWAEDADVLRDIDDWEDPVDPSDFKEAAKTRSGSRDLGAQLFCALLRSVAVDTRLVFSLQPLPFSGVAKGVTPEKAKPQYIYASSNDYKTPYSNSQITVKAASPSNPRWRASEFASKVESSYPLKRSLSSKKHIKDSPYPIFWVEVFSPSIDKWIPVDPLVRHTFNKPRTGYEPPASDRLNSMSYVIAFEDDSSARDVTRRYSSQYNAKTRKLRVETTKGGQNWWRQTMGFFERPFPETRDEIEDNELAAREAQEGMPKSVGDFKGHPVFALERHLRRNEVIYPLREAGKVSSGAGANLEPVYRRKDVHVVRSADQWYRKGRDVKEGEQPLKWAITRQGTRSTPIGEDEMNEDSTGLYAEFQTDVYVPPPVVDGKIPRNAYGNLDVYVPSMIPGGAIHLQHAAAACAGKALGIDYTDAVTGFHFKGRQGTAIVNGIVAAEEYREALVEVIKWMEREQAEEEQEKRKNLALHMWKRFMAALRIKEKIEKEYADAGSDEDMTDPVYDGNESPDDEEGGGFFLDADTNEGSVIPLAAQSALEAAPLLFVPSKITVTESPHKLKKPELEAKKQTNNSFESVLDKSDSRENGAGFFIEQVDDKESGGFVPKEDDSCRCGGFITDEDIGAQGGEIFSNEDNNQEGGVASKEHHDKHDAMPARGLDVALGGRLPISNTPGGSASLRDGSQRSAITDRLEKPPASIHRTSALSIKDVESSRSPDSIDNQSLLSHDPEDEDAEPEWLVDDEEL